MANQREKREGRQSAARRRASQRESGYGNAMLRLPEGLGFWQFKEGFKTIDIVPYRTGKGNPYSEEGEYPYFERTFYRYRKIGPEEISCVAPGKTFGKPDYIQEVKQRESRNPDADKDYLKSLNPQERQLFLVYDHDEPAKGVQLWEYSFHQFGKLLDSRIQKSPESRGWDQFYYPDERGFSLELTLEEEKPYGVQVKAIDFVPRKEPLPEKIVNHGYCLDDFLVEISYERLKRIFLGLDETEEEKEGGRSSRGEDDDDRPTRARGAEEDTQEDRSSARREEPEDKEEEPEEKPKPKRKVLTAEDVGLERGDKVKYKGQVCEVFKISGDGTSLTLVDADDDVIKAVGVDEVELRGQSKVSKPEPEPKKQEKSEKPKAKDKDEDDWDADWN